MDISGHSTGLSVHIRRLSTGSCIEWPSDSTHLPNLLSTNSARQGIVTYWLWFYHLCFLHPLMQLMQSAKDSQDRVDEHSIQQSGTAPSRYGKHQAPPLSSPRLGIYGEGRS